jgi:hypothetical protein
MESGKTHRKTGIAVMPFFSSLTIASIFYFAIVKILVFVSLTVGRIVVSLPKKCSKFACIKPQGLVDTEPTYHYTGGECCQLVYRDNGNHFYYFLYPLNLSVEIKETKQ